MWTRLFGHAVERRMGVEALKAVEKRIASEVKKTANFYSKENSIVFLKCKIAKEIAKEWAECANKEYPYIDLEDVILVKRS